MEKILQLLYVGEVIGNINMLSCNLFTLTIMLLLIYVGVGTVRMGEWCYDADERKKKEDFLQKWWGYFPKYQWILYVALLISSLQVVIPSKDFIYICAGAEAAKQVSKTSIAGKTLQLIEKKLDDAIAEKMQSSNGN